MGYPTANPGFVDVYGVKQDCRHPVLDSSSPMDVKCDGQTQPFHVNNYEGEGGGSITVDDALRTEPQRHDPGQNLRL